MSTRQRPDAVSMALALKAAKNDQIEHSAASERRHFRHQIGQAESEASMLRKALDAKTQAMAGLQNHNQRLRDRENDALDGKKWAEIEVLERQREAEVARLELVAARAECAALAQQTAAAHARMLAAEKKAAAEMASAAERDAKAAQLRRRVAQLSGRIGGEHSTKRTISDMLAMPVDDPVARNRRRVAKHEVVSELAAAIAAAKDEPKLVAEALSKAGLMHQVLKNTKMGQDIIFSHSKQLAKSLADVWDEDLSTEFKDRWR